MSRSETMSMVKSKNTKPEIYVRKLLWSKGIRYRVNYNKLPGKPDIFISKYNTVIFVNGCFWHFHKNCKLSVIPKTNVEFWTNKFKNNQNRDKSNYKKLKKLGIKVIVIWGCQIDKMLRNDKKVIERINKILDNIVQTPESSKP